MSRRVETNSQPNKCGCGAMTFNVVVGHGSMPFVLCDTCIEEIAESRKGAQKR